MMSTYQYKRHHFDTSFHQFHFSYLESVIKHVLLFMELQVKK